MIITDDMKNAAWEAAQVVDGYDSMMFRKDACGAWIIYDKYGQQDSIFGWQVDHIYPAHNLDKKGFSEEEINNPKNLRALQHQNNASKGDDYPTYISVVTSDGNNNIELRRSLDINEVKQAELAKIYKL